MDKSIWHRLLDSKVTRREVLQVAGVAGLAASSGLTGEAEAGANNGAATVDTGVAQRSYPPFTPIGPTTADTMTLPAGYSFIAASTRLATLNSLAPCAGARWWAGRLRFRVRWATARVGRRLGERC